MGSAFTTGEGSDVVEARRARAEYIIGFLEIFEVRHRGEDLESRCGSSNDRGGTLAIPDENC